MLLHCFRVHYPPPDFRSYYHPESAVESREKRAHIECTCPIVLCLHSFLVIVANEHAYGLG
jgi:hypothetical protein